MLAAVHLAAGGPVMRMATVLAAAAGLAAGANLAPAAPLAATPATTPAALPAATVAAEADRAVRQFMSDAAVPAAHVTILRGEKVALSRGYLAEDTKGSPPDATTIFPLGSFAKQFTAATILALADAGTLSLAAPVGKYLPEWFGREPDLRVEHLLVQTSGLADFLWLDGYRALGDDSASPLAAYVALGAAEPRRFAPGTRWAYSNTNYKALALIVERVTGRPFDDVLHELVLRPAGIGAIRSCHRLQPGQYIAGVSQQGGPAPLDPSAAAYTGDGGLCGDASSITRWLRYAFAPGADGSARLARLARPGRLADGTEVPYGFGVSTREFLGHAMIWHGGNVDGHSMLAAYLPGQDLSVVVLTNRGFVWLTELLPALIGAEPPARQAASAGPLAGQFEDGLFRYAIEATGDTMRVEIDLIGPLTFVPAAPREYVAQEFPSSFRMRLPADGSPDRFEMDWAEVRSYAQRVR